MQHPSRFDQIEQACVWEYDTGDGQKHDLFMDAGPNMSGETEKSEAKNTPPYTLGAAIDEPGLGLLTWWENT